MKSPLWAKSGHRLYRNRITTYAAKTTPRTQTDTIATPAARLTGPMLGCRSHISMLRHNLRWDQPNNKSNARWDDDEIVHISKHRHKSQGSDQLEIAHKQLRLSRLLWRTRERGDPVLLDTMREHRA